MWRSVFADARDWHGRFNDMLYTPAGREIADRLWEETMRELRFADVEGILRGMTKGR